MKVKWLCETQGFHNDFYESVKSNRKQFYFCKKLFLMAGLVGFLLIFKNNKKHVFLHIYCKTGNFGMHDNFAIFCKYRGIWEIILHTTSIYFLLFLRYLLFYFYLFYFILLSPPVHIVRWAHMRRFLSVCHTFKKSYLRMY